VKEQYLLWLLTYISTRCGLDDLGFETHWSWYFPYSSRPALRPTQPHFLWVWVSFPGVERPDVGVDYPV